MGERIISETGQVYAGVRGGVEIGQVVEWNKHAGKELIVNGEALVRLRLEEIEGTWESTE
jgi:hypothetical protein